MTYDRNSYLTITPPYPTSMSHFHVKSLPLSPVIYTLGPILHSIRFLYTAFRLQRLPSTYFFKAQHFND